MKIGALPAASSMTYPVTKNKGNNFSDYLAETVATKKKTEKSSPYATEIDEIMKKGFLKYIKEEEEEKIREKILSLMGLTEEDLASLSAEQKAKIEQLIADEIQKRQAADLQLFGKDDEGGQVDNVAARRNAVLARFDSGSAANFAKALAYDPLQYGPIGGLIDLSGTLPDGDGILRYSGDGSPVTEESEAYFEAENARFLKEKIEMYASESAKNTEPMKILEKLLTAEDEQPERFRKMMGWG
jgi:hypothetical protein